MVEQPHAHHWNKHQNFLEKEHWARRVTVPSPAHTGATGDRHHPPQSNSRRPVASADRRRPVMCNPSPPSWSFPRWRRRSRWGRFWTWDSAPTCSSLRPGRGGFGCARKTALIVTQQKAWVCRLWRKQKHEFRDCAAQESVSLHRNVSLEIATQKKARFCAEQRNNSVK